VVTPSEVMTTWLGSSCTPAYPMLKAGNSHQVVVARRPSRIPPSASGNVPAHAKAIDVPCSRVRSSNFWAGSDGSEST
jgi:hypothetical protein